MDDTPNLNVEVPKESASPSTKDSYIISQIKGMNLRIRIIYVADFAMLLLSSFKFLQLIRACFDCTPVLAKKLFLAVNDSQVIDILFSKNLCVCMST